MLDQPDAQLRNRQQNLALFALLLKIIDLQSRSNTLVTNKLQPRYSTRFQVMNWGLIKFGTECSTLNYDNYTSLRNLCGNLNEHCPQVEHYLVLNRSSSYVEDKQKILRAHFIALTNTQTYKEDFFQPTVKLLSTLDSVLCVEDTNR